MAERPLSEVLAEYPALKGLKGDKGDPGDPGSQGDPGPQGIPGPASISILPFHSDASANLTLTNQVAAEQGLGNSNRNEAFFDATSFTQVRVVTRVVTAGAAAARLMPQFSTNGTVFTTIGTGTGADAVSLTPIGAKTSSWLTLPAGAKANVIFRIAQIGGDGVLDPALGHTALQFR